MRLVIVLIAARATVAMADPECGSELGPNPDAETLYNAGVCHEESAAIGAALELYRMVFRKHPSSDLAPRAMARAAVLYESVASFEQAAAIYLDYSRRYPAERDAPDALRRAIVLFDAIGNWRVARSAVEQFVKLYGRRRAGDAAAVYFAAAGIYQRAGDDDALIAHLERYLGRFGSRGGRDRAAIAHATIGTLLWRRSCRLGGAGADGRLCRRPARRTRAPRCDEKVLRTRRVRRDRALVKRARMHLEQAVAIHHPPPRATTARERAAAYWRSRAELALLERDLEDYLDDAFPRGLDFDPKKRELRLASVKRFTGWLSGKQKQASALHERYKELARGAGDVAAAAALRLAQLSLHLRDELAGSEIPASVLRGPYATETRAAYCDALRQQIEPLAAHAVTALKYCLARPAWSRWSATCAAALVRLAPRDHPPAPERHGTATHLAPVLDTAGSVSD